RSQCSFIRPTQQCRTLYHAFPDHKFPYSTACPLVLSVISVVSSTGAILSTCASSESAGSTTHLSVVFFSSPHMVTFVSKSPSWISPANPHRRTLAFSLWTFSTNMAVTISILMARDTAIVTGPRSGRGVAGRRKAPRATALVTITMEEML
ncbi:uncharacterized protein EV420DRAFT_737630, partial [Desarmillaria tabescens]